MHGVSLEELEEDTARPYKALTLDVEYYQRMLDHPDQSDAQRDEILKSLWSIMCFFVEVGYRVEPSESCGKDDDVPDLSGMQAGDLLGSKPDPVAQTFEKVAALAASKEKP